MLMLLAASPYSASADPSPVIASSRTLDRGSPGCERYPLPHPGRPQLLTASGNPRASDSQGDLVRELLERITEREWNRVILNDLSRHDHPVGFNVLASEDP
jgi:hypothetical protein